MVARFLWLTPCRSAPACVRESTRMRLRVVAGTLAAHVTQCPPELAARLAIPLRTLYDWQKHSADPARRRGPKPRRGSNEQRQAVDDTLA